MTIKKIGSSEKIRSISNSLSFDINLAVKKIKDTHKGSTITLNEVHEALKALGITNYSSDDMGNITKLLRSVGISIK